MQTTPKNDNPLWLLLSIQRPDNIDSKRKLDTLKLLTSVELLTDDLIDLLKEKKFITAEESLDELLTLAEKKGGFYEFPSGLKDYLDANEIGPKEINIADLTQLLFDFYDQKRKDSAENKSVQKRYYAEVFKLLVSNPEDLGKWLLKSTEDLLYANECDFLEPFLVRAYNALKKEGAPKSEAIQLFEAILLGWLSFIHMEKVEQKLAFSAIKNSLNTFENISSEKLPENQRDFCRQKHVDAYVKKSEIEYRSSKFTEAIASLNAADDVWILPDTPRQYGKIYQAIGSFWHAELNYLKLKSWIDNFDEKVDPVVKEQFQTAARNDIGNYLRELGFFKAASRIDKENFIKQAEKPEPDLWQAAAYRSLGLTIAEMYRNQDPVEGFTIEEGILYLEKSIKIFDSIPHSERYKSSVYLSLAKCTLVQKNAKLTEKYLKEGLNFLLSSEFPQSKIYYSFYRCYAALLNTIDSTEESFEIYMSIYEKLFSLEGFHSQLNNSLIDTLQKFEQTTPELQAQLSKHKTQIDYLTNPYIRTKQFKKVAPTATKEILEKIHSENITLIPFNDLPTTIKEYKLPYFTDVTLIMMSTATKIFPIVRYFLYKKTKNEISLLDTSNTEVYAAAATSLKLSSHEDGMFYIRLFVDVVESKHGKFFTLEDLDTDIRWDIRVPEKTREEALENISKVFNKPTFLFAENKNGEEFWHYQYCMLYKAALFTAKIELNTKKGFLRMYDDNLLLQDLPVRIDNSHADFKAEEASSN